MLVLFQWCNYCVVLLTKLINIYVNLKYKYRVLQFANTGKNNQEHNIEYFSCKLTTEHMNVVTEMIT